MSADSPAVLLKTNNSTAVLNKYMPGVIECSVCGDLNLVICLFGFAGEGPKNECFICFVWWNGKLYHDKRSSDEMKSIDIYTYTLKENPINTWKELKDIMKKYIEYYIKYYEGNERNRPNRVAILKDKLKNLN